MGRRRGKVNAMSNSLLVKDKHKMHGQRGNSDAFVHTTELDDGVTYNRINFQSVTEQSSLEDFLNTAEMAGRDFAAERQNISIISNPGQGISLTADDMKNISNAQQQHKELLRIPRRPPWNEFTTKEELLLMERDSFTAWRRQLKLLEEKEHIQLTPYEKNLDFWRQLWRVIERSDVVVQIVDARNPLLFRCEDLEIYVKEVHKEKMVMLLVNKADYLSLPQRSQWVEFFNKHGIQGVFFSAKTENEKHEDLDPIPAFRDLDIIEESEEEEESTDDDEDDTDDEEEEDNNVEEDNRIPTHTDKEAETPTTHLDDVNCDVTGNSNKRIDCDINNSNSTATGQIEETSPLSNHHQTVSGQANTTESEQESSNKEKEDCSDSGKKSGLLLENIADIVSAERLLDIFRELAHPSAMARSGEVKTIGMVGYPNVGKSSTINVILKEKKLAVSATPGRTKHLQTLFVADNLMLCDCPGLVFPTFVATKAHLVINGILPIDELRDHVSPVNLICDHIPRNVLEATYSIMIPRPSVDDDQDRRPTVEELLNAYGGMRGFMTPRGIPDGPRASRYLLKDFVKGKLLYCNPPPGIEAAGFQDQTRVTEIEAAKPISKAPAPQIKSVVDEDFFVKRQSAAHSKGTHGVKGHVRVDCLRPTSSQSGLGDGSSVSGSIAGSSSSINSLGTGVQKPWKKHNNRKKKEKLRRLHKDLDVHLI